MLFNAYFPYSVIYTEQGSQAGAVLLHCMIDVGQLGQNEQNALDCQGRIESERGLETPHLLMDTLRIAKPWKLVTKEFVYMCYEPAQELSINPGVKKVNEEDASKLRRVLRNIRCTIDPNNGIFVDGEYCAVPKAAESTFAMLLSPFMPGQQTGLYYIYATQQITMNVPTEYMQHLIAFYKYNMTRADAWAMSINNMLERAGRIQRVTYELNDNAIATKVLKAKVSRAEGAMASSSRQLMGKEAPYTVDVWTVTNERRLTVHAPLRMSTNEFDRVIVTKNGLTANTQLTLGENTKHLTITAVPAAGAASCVLQAGLTTTAKLETLNCFAIMPNADRLKRVIALGCEHSALRLGIPAVQQPEKVLNLEELSVHSRHAELALGIQPMETLLLGETPTYRHSMIVTQPTCNVKYVKAKTATKHENKFMVDKAQTAFFIPTFSKPHAITVDLTAFTTGRHLLAFTDALSYAAASNRSSGGRDPDTYMSKYVQSNLTQLKLPPICGNENAYAANPEAMQHTKVWVKTSTNTGFVLSTALDMSVQLTKAVNTLVFVEPVVSAPNAVVHVYGNVGTLYILPNRERQYTYYMHGDVGAIVCCDIPYGRTRRALFATIKSQVTVHVPAAVKPKIYGRQTATPVTLYMSEDYAIPSWVHSTYDTWGSLFGGLIPVEERLPADSRIALEGVPNENTSVMLIGDVQK